MTQELIDALQALKDKVTEETLDPDGRYFDSGNYQDLTQCHHGDTGNFRNRDDGRAVALLWNLWKSGALDPVLAPAAPPSTPRSQMVGSEAVAIQALKKIESAALGGYLTPDLCAEIVTSALAPEDPPTSSFDVESWAAGDGVWNGDKWVPAGNSEGKR